MVNIKDLFQKGYKYHQSGNLDAAATCYIKVLDKQPKHTDTIFLTGTLHLQQGNFDAATVFLKKAIALKPDYVTAYVNLGVAQQSQGKLEEAIDNYRLAIRHKPNDAEVYKNLGNALREKGELDEAIVSYRKATVLNPDDAEAHNDLGAALQKSGKFDEAMESHRQAIRLRPDYAKAHNNLGTAFNEQGKRNEAIASYRHALSLKPDYAEAHNNLGVALQKQEKLNEAIVSYDRAIALKPDYAEAYYNLGNTLKLHGKTDEAVKSYKQAITLDQNDAKAYINLGIVFHEQGKLDEAVAIYRHALSLKPDHAETYTNLGAVLQEQGKLDEAIASYDRSISLKPDFAEAHINKSLALLLTENFEQGWQEYEWRLRTKNRSFPTLHQPRWDGTPLNGRSILVHAEQGLGDTIQFIRYLPMVRARGGYVIFKCPPVLFRLLRNCKGFDEIIEEQIAANESAVQFDVYIPLLSLPGIFGTRPDTIPSDTPYIPVNPNLVSQWKLKLGNNDDYKIGIVWAGNPKHKDDRKRSCSLADFAPLANIPGLVFYSLQKEPASTEACNPPENMKLINLENELNDFADTAAVIANLDLVISVDTAVAHLAGGLGKPVWNLLFFSPDWRWLRNRNDSSWYPGMRLFRQTRLNDWAGVFEQVKKALITQYSALKV
ncbi:MAG: tetratricopeptide repeat protein [Candidatus Scalindua sp.]